MKNEQKIYPSSCARETYGLEDKVEFHMKNMENMETIIA